MLRRTSHIAEEYLQSFQQGEEKAFDYYFKLHYAALTLFCFRIIKDRDAAEEIVQEAYIRLWERHENFFHPAALKSFLFTVCKNLSLDWLHAAKKKR